MIERQASNLMILCDIVRPFVMNDPALLKAFRKQLKHWANEKAIGESARDEAREAQRYALEVITRITLPTRIEFPDAIPF